MLELAQSHYSIRSYKRDSIDETLLNDLLLAGLQFQFRHYADLVCCGDRRLESEAKAL